MKSPLIVLFLNDFVESLSDNITQRHPANMVSVKWIIRLGPLLQKSKITSCETQSEDTHRPSAADRERGSH